MEKNSLLGPSRAEDSGGTNCWLVAERTRTSPRRPVHVVSVLNSPEKGCSIHSVLSGGFLG